MQTEIEFAAQRFSVFAGQVIEPAVYESTAALDAAAMQCTDPIAHEEAVRGAYQPVPLGWRWGPVWSTAWFRVTGHVPAGMRGRKVVLRFSSGTEATLWRDGVPYFGFDPNHDAVTLFDRAAGGEAVELFIEAACNRPLGATFFWWDTPELRQQWEGPAPGRLTHCELAVFNPEIWRLWRTYDFARQLLLLCPPDSPRARSLIDGLRRATALLDPGNIHEQAARAQEELGAALRGQPPTRTRCIAVGQGHMDTAWLWRFRETRRKCLRTFSTALRLMEEFPDYHFLWSQAQQYAWVQQDSPGLFARVAERVREGRWEASGAMWVEPDCNVPSGESLVRQILHAARWWQRAFGAHGRQTFLYLPDTFGFSAALPQIMDLAGLGTFITNKMSWNDMNEFPYTTFRWRGLDGTEVIGHCTPGRDYNANLTPVELQRGEKEISRKNGGATAAWLQPFGFGDGGGGPTAGMLQNALIARECEGLPEVRMGRTESLCAELHRQREELRAQGQDLPAWDGELYLEYHRGTYTTQAWLKQANRRHEQALRAAEWLAFAGPAAPDAARTAGIMRRLDEAWKLLLLDQFHDVLPGSSIAEVYADVRQQQAQIEATCEAIIREETTRWASAADNRGRRRPMAVFNSCAAARGGVVDCEGETHYVAAVPAMGMAVRDRAAPPPVQAVVVDGRALSNGILSATIDELGRIVSLRRVGAELEACRRRPDGSVEPMNQLVLYDDRPRYWDAWDIDIDHAEKAMPQSGPAESWQVAAAGPLRVAIEVARPLGKASRMTQRFVLEAGSPRLDIRTHVDWHEEHRLLRALFPVNVRARRATYEIQFGHVERATHHNTSWDRARFEVCAHRWMDLAEPGFGVALLNDCKYGHSCHDGIIGLSLLRGPRFPDTQADIGEHEFAYSLMVHQGDWRAAGVDREAEALNTPLRAVPLPPNQGGAIAGEWAPFTVSVQGAAGMALSAVKRAEDDDRLIVRLAETHGGHGRATIDWALPVRTVEVVDLLERALAMDGFAHDAAQRRTTMNIRPFQIVTLAARR